MPTRQPLNGGTPCPGPQEEPCLPEVCYFAENPSDKNFGYGGRKQDMRPLRTLPPDHIALKSGANTLLSSLCPNLKGLTRQSIVPAYNASYDEKCSGADLFYALDDTTSMSLSGMDKDETVQLFLLQNTGAELYFGIMNGKSASDGDDSFANIRIDLENINTQNKGVDWQVQNDPASASNAGKSAIDCFLADSKSGGCYQWSKTTKIGVSKWRWDESMTSGGILGPLPSYGFCAVLKRGDIRGIKGYEFADGGVGEPDTNGIPTYGPDANGIQHYKSAVPMTPAAFDLGKGIRLCTYPCATGPDLNGINPNPIGDGGNSGSVNGGSGNGNDGSGGSGSISGGDGSSSGDGENGVNSGSTDGGDDKGNGGDNTGQGRGDEITSEDDKGDAAVAGGESDNNPSDNEGMSAGVIGGVVGGVAGCLILTVVAALLIRRRRSSKRDELQSTEDLPQGWTSYIDEASGAPVYEHESGVTQWEHPGPSEDSLAVEMVKSENPLRSAQEGGSSLRRTETQLPDGWSKDYTEEGDKYYVNDHNGDTSWDAPPGATGGSTGIPVGDNPNPVHVRNMTAGWADGEKYFEDADGNTTWDEYNS